MGLDMYLRGEKFLRNDREEDGHRIETIVLDLGYWRKHPNLHGYIVQKFGGDVDECQQIDLSADALRKIAAAIRADDLPHTEGFFFGSSDFHQGQKEENATIFETASTWMETKDAASWRSVYYRASW